MAGDPELAVLFEPNVVAMMKRGRAPVARETEQVGRRIKLELHHKIFISEGGGVYAVDNIGMMTPKNHIETHKRSGDE